MRFYFFFILFLFTSIQGIAQEFGLESNIKDGFTEAGIDNVLIEIEGTDLVQITDENGHFSFDETIPLETITLHISKPGYKNLSFVLSILPNKRMELDNILIYPGKSKKRKKTKETPKEKKGEAEEGEEKKDKKGIAGLLGFGDKGPKDALPEMPKTDKLDEVQASKDSILANENVEAAEEIKMKYAQITGTSIEEITNDELYEFVDDWMETPYRMGGESKSGIDCSFFAQTLYMNVYGSLIERTAERQCNSESITKFRGYDYLKEGDLIFFRGQGDNYNSIVHVGVYLKNNKFVHATANKERTGKGGVKISDLTDAFWTNRFYCAGRRAKK